MSHNQDSKGTAHTGNRTEMNTHSVSGWETDTKLVRTYDRSANIADAVTSTITETIERWPELSATPPLYQFVDVEKLDGLFKTKATDDSGWLPSAKFQFQGCRVTVLYGSSIRVIVVRDL
jgi:hypothetical protein